MWQEPLISVVIPVYNGDPYLAEAIESVLAQTYPAVEVIVIDDGSTDKSADVAKQYVPQIRYFYQHNGGQQAALNHGIALTHGDFLAFLDADDLWTKSKLEHQMDVIIDNPEIDAVFGHVEQFYSPDMSESERLRIRYNRRIMPGYHAGSMLISREAFMRVGDFESQWRVGGFIDWYARATRRGLRSIMLDEVVMRRRLHGSNMGLRERASQKDYLYILKAKIDRQREDAGP